MTVGAGPLLEGIAAVAALALAALASVGLARRFLPDASRSTHLVGAFVLGAALLVTAFRALAAVSLFGALPALIAFAGVAWWARSPEPRRTLRASGLPRSAWALALLPFTLVLAACALRGLAAPPLGWDALTYHLYRAGRWVRDGHAAVQAAPGAWGYYEWFPRTGDSFWSWALLAMRDGGMLAAAGVVVLLAAALGAYALARTLDAKPADALLAAGAVAATPAVANAVTVAYVDNTVLALTLAGCALAVEGIRGRGLGAIALAGLAFGLAGATKYSMLQPLAGAFVVIAWAVGARRAAVFAAAAAFPLVLECADRWVQTGSPVWPFRLAVAGREIFAGNEELVLLLQGQLALPGQAVFEAGTFVRWLVSPGRHAHAQSLGVGPVAAVLIPLGVVALVLGMRDRRRRAAPILALAVAALTITATLGEDNIALRTLWAQTYARFTMPAFAIAMVAAATLGAAWSRGLLALHVLAGAALAWPHGWSAPDPGGALRATVPAAAGLALAALVHRLAPRGRLVLATIAGALPALVLLPGIRADLRYAVYERAADPAPAFDMHELNRDYAAAWPIWRALDDGSPHRIAAAAGWDGTGHNAYLFPLLGSRLQNEVVYVPPARDGRVIDYREGEALARAAHHDAWVGRLDASRIDAFVALAPPPPERAAWIETDPGRFEPLAGSAEGLSAAWRVYPPAPPGPGP